MPRRFLFVALLVTLFLVEIAGSVFAVLYGAKNPQGLPAWTIRSAAFRANGLIPAKYTADGANVSPALTWTIPPRGTAQLALVCHDPDAPAGDWVHWVIYDMPPTLRALSEAIPTTPVVTRLSALRQGKNGSGTIGYSGPNPPGGKVHHYHFVLYALDTKLTLRAGASRDDLTRTMQGHILKQTEVVGTYAR